MKRKLIKQGGGGGLTFYVPKAWIDEQGLKPGDEIEIDDVENKLIVTAQANKPKHETFMNLTTENRTAIRINLSNRYRLGYDKIVINCETDSQMRQVKDIADTFLLDFEVSDEKKNKIILENMTEPSQEKHDVILRRMFLIIKESLQLLREDLANSDNNNSKEIVKLSEKAMKYMNFLRRSIFKKRFTEERGHFYWGLYADLILTQHSIWHLYEQMDKEKRLKITKKAATIVDRISADFTSFYESFFRRDTTRMTALNSSMSRYLYNDLFQELKKSKGFDNIVHYYLSELCRVIYLGTASSIGIIAE